MCSAPGRCTCAGETKIPASTQTLDPIFVIVVFDCNNICRCPVCKFLFKMSETRVKNTATAPQIAKCLRPNVTCLDPKKYMASSDKVAETYTEFCQVLLRLTMRPTMAVLLPACEEVFPDSTQFERKDFCERVLAAVQHARSLGKNMTSGAKTDVFFKPLVRLLYPSRSPEARPAKSTSSATSVRHEQQQPRSRLVSDSPVKKCKSDVFNLYGLHCANEEPKLPTTEDAAHEAPEEINLVSSQEESEAPAIVMPTVFLDLAKNCLVFVREDGQQSLATMQLGPEQFAVGVFAEFPGRIFPSELPNLMLLHPPMACRTKAKGKAKSKAKSKAKGKPQAKAKSKAMKAKSKAKQKAKAPLQSEEDSEEEEEEQEETADEAGEAEEVESKKNEEEEVAVAAEETDVYARYGVAKPDVPWNTFAGRVLPTTPAKRDAFIERIVAFQSLDLPSRLQRDFWTFLAKNETLSLHDAAKKFAKKHKDNIINI